MVSWQKAVKPCQAKSWLLIIMVSVQLFTQSHFHLHHVNSDKHVHAVDLHLLSDNHSGTQHGHDNTHELKSAPDILIKKNPVLDNASVFVLSVFLFVLFSVRLTDINRYWSSPQYLYPINLYYGLSPPLRAPPAA